MRPRPFWTRCVGASYQIESLDKKPGKRSPAAPFTTSTLQQEASRKLGFSVAQTMSVAQKLYEAGKISYMRTDSVNLSGEAMAGAAGAITAAYGAEYHHTRTFQNQVGFGPGGPRSHSPHRFFAGKGWRATPRSSGSTT